MTKKKWILLACFTVTVAVICAVTYAEKAEKAEVKSLPAAAEAAVKAAFPKSAIEKSSIEKMKLKVYEVELKDGSMIIAEDGTVATIETVEEEKSLPAPIAAAIKAQNGKLVKVEKDVKKAELKLVKLDKPETSYEATISKDGKETEVVIAADGKIMEQKAMDKEEKDKD